MAKFKSLKEIDPKFRVAYIDKLYGPLDFERRFIVYKEWSDLKSEMIRSRYDRLVIKEADDIDLVFREEPLLEKNYSLVYVWLEKEENPGWEVVLIEADYAFDIVDIYKYYEDQGEKVGEVLKKEWQGKVIV